jgi:hypothetical protein
MSGAGRWSPNLRSAFRLIHAQTAQRIEAAQTSDTVADLHGGLAGFAAQRPEGLIQQEPGLPNATHVFQRHRQLSAIDRQHPVI